MIKQRRFIFREKDLSTKNTVAKMFYVDRTFFSIDEAEELAKDKCYGWAMDLYTALGDYSFSKTPLSRQARLDRIHKETKYYIFVIGEKDSPNYSKGMNERGWQGGKGDKMNKLLKTIKENDKRFEKEFSIESGTETEEYLYYNFGRASFSYRPADKGDMKSHIRQSRIKELEALVEMWNKVEKIDDYHDGVHSIIVTREDYDNFIQTLQNTIKKLKDAK